MADVVSIHGGPTGQPEPSPTCIQVLEEWLEKARSGEIVGVAIAGLCHDSCGCYALAGKVGGYSMLGAVDMAKADLLTVLRDE